MRILSSFILASLLLSACANPAKVETEDEAYETGDEAATEDTETPPATEVSLQVGLIAMEDNGASGPLVGCGDSLVFVTQTVEGPLTREEKIQSALEALFAIKESTYGESGLYNSLYQTDLTVDSVHLEDGQLEVVLSGAFSSGGVCDDPRLIEQIEETAENNAGLDTPLEVHVLVNGKSLEQTLNAKGD